MESSSKKSRWYEKSFGVIFCTRKINVVIIPTHTAKKTEHQIYIFLEMAQIESVCEVNHVRSWYILLPHNMEQSGTSLINEI